MVFDEQTALLHDDYSTGCTLSDFTILRDASGINGVRFAEKDAICSSDDDRGDQ